MFNNVSWAIFDPVLGNAEETIFGLRSLMFIFPAIALIIGLIVISRWPITKERYERIKEEVEMLHEKKKQSIS